MTGVAFICRHFSELTPRELYAMLALRAQVFVIEQKCVYLDPDGLDVDALHLFGWNERDPADLMCGARVLAPGAVYDDASIGRVVTSPWHRGGGVGRVLMLRALEECARHYPGSAITIGAQHYLEKFYLSLGFETVSAPYDEDGIPHVTMRRPA